MTYTEITRSELTGELVVAHCPDSARNAVLVYVAGPCYVCLPHAEREGWEPMGLISVYPVPGGEEPAHRNGWAKENQT